MWQTSGIALIIAAVWLLSVRWFLDYKNHVIVREDKNFKELEELCRNTVEACNRATDSAVNAASKADEALKRVGRIELAVSVNTSRGVFGAPE